MKCSRFRPLALFVATLLLLLVSCNQRQTGSSPTAASISAEATPMPPLRIDAAASLRNVLISLGTSFAKDHKTVIKPQFASSGQLAQQLLAAPRADVFLSASSRWMDKLAQAGKLAKGTRRDLFHGVLVLVAHRDAPFSIKGLEELAALPVERIVIGEPDSVPAGRYAKELLEKRRDFEGHSLWQRLEKKFVTMPSVTAVAAQVVASHGVVGFVYGSDATDMKELRILASFPPPDGPRVVYPGAVLGQSTHPEARAFLDFLETPAARGILVEHGFVVSPGLPNSAR